MKGSVTCDGASLTVSGLAGDYFEVALIPYTWENTSFRHCKKGEAVNIETDMIGKYARRQMTHAAAGGGLTLEKLSAAGFDA
jgi:riboflavin synthase